MKPLLGIADQVLSYDQSLRERLLDSITYGGREGTLDQRDCHLVVDCLVMRFCLLFDLLDKPTLSRIPTCDRAEEIRDAWRRTTLGLKTLDVEPYNQDWKTLREITTSPDVRQFYGSLPYSAEREACLQAFKRLAAGKIHYKWILNSAISIVERGGLDWFEILNQWVVFDSRVNLRSLDLTTDCCTDYLEFEEGLPETTWWDRAATYGELDDDYMAELLGLCRLVAKELFGDFVVTDYPFRPTHGNGATAEVHGAELDWWHKNRHFEVDEQIITYLKYRLAESDWRNALFVPYRGVPRVSELRCVPKSMTSNRTISMEPTTLQFLQQDVFAALDDYFKDHPEVRVDLHDQDASRRLCSFGSSDGSYATIDLSSASDSVTLGLINQLFGQLPMHYPLVALRSTHTHVSDDKDIDVQVELKKYAPMGSALCFPVECMVFSIACEAAVRRCTGRRSRKFDYRVYGDDIVIRSEYVRELLAILEQLGFCVNKSKSFYDVPSLDETAHYGVFREACGIEAINGKEITPLRLSRRLVSPTDNDSDHQAGLGVGLVDLVNRAFLFGYMTLRRWVNDVLRRHLWYRTCLRVDEDSYQAFSLSIRAGETPWVPLAIPYVITPIWSDTQWRAFDANNCVIATPHHAMIAKVTVATSGENDLLRNSRRYQDASKIRTWLAGRVLPRLRRTTVVRFEGPDNFVTRTKLLKQYDASLHDENDYFSWWVKVGRQPGEDELLRIDATGLVTIRSRDLKWSQQWVEVIHPAHPSFSSKSRG